MDPQTPLAASFDFHADEPVLYRRWDEAGYFASSPDESRTPYCIVIPPPNVTGELHMGHAMQHTIHDVLLRWKRMRGYNVLCVPGTDHAGISTQMKVENQLMAETGRTRWDVGRDELVELIWDWTRHYGGQILVQFRALGCSYDWSRTVFTLDEHYYRAVMQAFVRFYERGWIYRGERVVNWCPSCHTVISDLEVENVAQNGGLWYIRYPLTDGDGDVVVATTRPETMLGDTAVAVHPDDERWRALVGKTVVLPLMGREIPIVADEYADPTTGSGAVKITPAHDPNDFDVAARHDLPSITVIDDAAMMNDAAGRFAGMDRYEARDAVVAALEADGFLVSYEDYEHDIPTHDRCHTVIEPLAKEQWFVNMRDLADQALPVLERGEIRYVPARFREYSIEWLHNIRDWCISRQLWWGHRIPVWTCAGCGELVVQATTPETCPGCGGTALEQDPDVLDTWFSSELWPFAVLGWPDRTDEFDYYYPTQVLITGREILYLWVVRMIMSSVEFTGEIPFDDVLVHPTILDKDGRRMSKSLGTGVDPLVLIEMYGADALRFALLHQCSSTQDARFDAEIVDGQVVASKTVEMARNFVNKIWNVSKLVLLSVGEDDFAADDAGEALPRADLSDRWILSELDRAERTIEAALEAYEFDVYARSLYDFIWSEFCDWYVEMAKFRVAGDGVSDAEAADAAAARRVLVHVLRRMLKLIHPAMPFVSETLWQALPGHGDTIMHARWSEREEGGGEDGEAVRAAALLQDLVQTIRRLRAEANLPGQRVRVTAHLTDPGLAAVAAANERYIVGLCRLEAWEATSAAAFTPPANALAEAMPGAELFLAIDDPDLVAEQVKRIAGKLDKVGRELAQVERKLGNEKFVGNAAPDVVAGARAKRVELAALRDKLARQLALFG